MKSTAAALTIAHELDAHPSGRSIGRLAADLANTPPEPTISDADLEILIRAFDDLRYINARRHINLLLSVAYINGRTEGIHGSTARIGKMLDHVAGQHPEEPVTHTGMPAGDFDGISKPADAGEGVGNG